MFRGRKRELAKILEKITSDKQENILLYGRRRIGKTELLKEAIKQSGRKAILFQAQATSLEANLMILTNLISDYFNQPLIFNDLNSALRYLFAHENEDLIFAIDEYPYLRAFMNGMDSIFQHIIDDHRTSRIKIVFTGSYIDVMEEMIQANSPLFGRIKLRLFLSEFDYQEASLFYPDYSLIDKVGMYSVFGGNPYVLSYIDSNNSFEQNLIDVTIENVASINDYIELVLLKELRKLNSAHLVLSVIAAGKTNYTDILTSLAANFSSSTLAYTLDTLTKMDLISKITSLSSKEKTAKSKYVVKDNFIAYYFKFIFPNTSNFCLLEPRYAYQKLVKLELDTKWIPLKFENIAQQFLIIENRKNKINPPFIKIGTLWHHDPVTKTNGQFDIVTLDENGYIIYEVKFSEHPINNDVVAEEVRQLIACGVEYYNLGFFAKSGFEITGDHDYKLFDLTDLYNF
jgi:AAA+ ATPase superfamily predicted ATPase